MHSILFHIGSTAIYSYGLVVALGVICGMWFARRVSLERGVDWEKLQRVMCFTVASGIIGAWVMGYLLSNHHDKFSLTTGFAFYGVPLFGIPAFLFFARRQGLSRSLCGDITVLALCLAQSIGRLGCLLAGCCYGKPTNLPIAITLYSPIVPQSLHGIPLHPIQLYSAIAEFMLFLFLYSKFRHRSADCFLLLLYVIGYGVIRFFEEFLRGDNPDSSMWLGVSTNQAIAILSSVGALILWRRLRSNRVVQ